jgi:hypothetical protein
MLCGVFSVGYCNLGILALLSPGLGYGENLGTPCMRSPSSTPCQSWRRRSIPETRRNSKLPSNGGESRSRRNKHRWQRSRRASTGPDVIRFMPLGRSGGAGLPVAREKGPDRTPWNVSLPWEFPSLPEMRPVLAVITWILRDQPLQMLYCEETSAACFR